MFKAYDIHKRIHKVGQGRRLWLNILRRLMDFSRSLIITEFFQPNVQTMQQLIKSLLVKIEQYMIKFGHSWLVRHHFHHCEKLMSEFNKRKSRRRVMVLNPNLNPVDRSVMVASYPTARKKESREYDYCGGKNHTKDRCFKLHGHPKGSGGRFGSSRGRGSQVHMFSTTLLGDASSTSDATTTPTPEEILVFRKFCSKSISSHYAQLGIHSCVFNVSSTCPSWIINTGVSEHMTGSSNLFTSYTPCSGKDKVQVADDSLSPIFESGSIVCTPSFTLSFLLHILSFTVTNYLSNVLPNPYITWLLFSQLNMFFSTWWRDRRLAVVV